jgi:acyl-CoA dehydrogenase
MILTTIVPVLLVLSAAFFGLCFARRPFWAWVASGTLLIAWLRASGAIGDVSLAFLLASLGAAALVFGLRPLRRALVSRPLMPAMARVLPSMSDTERAALEAGTVWWDAELFGGDPDWRALAAFELKDLDAREREFLAGPVDELCRMLDDHRVTLQGDLPPEAWELIKRSGLMGMIIPREHGGLGFSARMQSAVVAKLSSRCVTAAVTVMVPNSLGPAELILHYGTEQQKRHFLPRLARGEEVPCFALTEPWAGSDAASMRSRGVVCRGTWQGREVLGMRLDWDKRYITLAPVATVVGLAFKLSDPDHLLGAQEDLGITCALIPADVPGVELGERHDPMGVPFLNGPTRGKGVFVPLECVIGGPAMAGRGWGMLMQCLAAGRGVSLPALATGATQLAARVASAHASVREQFGLAIGRFEGIEAKLARIAGLAYVVDSARILTLGAIDAGEKPAVVTAIMKAYTTEAMRVAVNDAMDVLGGAAVCRGPRNTLAHAYQSVPIGITVEGHNILTRSMIVFGQGAIRCHPWVQKELAAVAARDAAAFDAAFFGHVGHVFVNASRALLLGLSDGALSTTGIPAPAAKYAEKLTRYSAAFAFAADVAMGALGSALKRKENLSGRLADALAWLYLGSAAVKRFVSDGSPERDAPAFRWAMQQALHEIETALRGLIDNLPSRPVAWTLRALVFPLGARVRPPSDGLARRLARSVMDDGPARAALTRAIFVPEGDEPGLARLERALDAVVAAQPAREKVKDAQRAGTLPRGAPASVLALAVERGAISERECDLVRAADAARDEAVQVDSFAAEALVAASH